MFNITINATNENSKKPERFGEIFCRKFNSWNHTFEHGDYDLNMLFINYKEMSKFMIENKWRMNSSDKEHMAVLMYKYESEIQRLVNER